MNAIRHIRRNAAVLAGLVTAFVAAAITPAFAMVMPPSGGGRSVVLQYQAPIHIAVTGGMPGWQITLIAVGAALFAATLAVVLDRARSTRRHAITATA